MFTCYLKIKRKDVMKRNRFLHIYGLFISLFFIFIIISCVPKGYDFIGTWNRQPDNLTYINHDKHIKLTFPNNRWHVYTSPKEITNRELTDRWKKPSKESQTYDVLKAYIPETEHTSFSVMIDPVREENLDFTLEQYVSLSKYMLEMTSIILSGTQFEFENIDSDVIQRYTRRIGIVKGNLRIRTVKGNLRNLKFLNVTFEEEGRFISMNFGNLESLYESTIEQFWSIVDSYECIE